VARPVGSPATHTLRDMSTEGVAALLRCPTGPATDATASAEPSLGEQVRQFRVAAGLTQHQLAIRIGSTQPAVARLEAGLRTPTVTTLKRVAQALGHDLMLLLPCGDQAS
jgi:ribosome-binding protein aMBF1 (putative translation factor)